ncbi:MAG: hypothetical protein ACR2GT_06515 [Gaiellaceae bacterium]
MRAPRIAGPVAVALAFAVAALLALLAADVMRAQQALERGDARFAGAAGTAGMWTADTVLPTGASRSLLDVDDDLEFRAALQRFRLARPREQVTQFSQLAVRSGAERVLARAAVHTDRRRGSVLANLRGALALEEARLGTGSGPPLRRASGHFRRAVELDPTNDDARFNLELALRLLSSAASSSAGSGERAATPASGAGAASSGGGY